MSDFDSNPFADPDLNNPFKVSVVPSISRRRIASLLVKTDKFIRAHCAHPSASLCRLDWGSGPPYPFWGARPDPRAARLGVGAEPPQLRVRSTLPRSPTEERRALVLEWARGPGGYLARLSGAGREPRAGGVVTCPASVAGRAGTRRRWGEGSSPSRGSPSFGWGCHGDSRWRRRAAWGDGRVVQER